MIHAIRFSEDKLEYCNRAILTPKFLQETEYGRALYFKMGELPGMLARGEEFPSSWNIAKLLFIEMAKFLGAKPY